MNKNRSFEALLIRVLLSIGIVLPLLQFFMNRSLWIDEAFLALNIVNKNYVELLKPLDFMQAAPIIFLQIEKFFSDLIPNSELGLRIFPMISYFLSLYFFYKIIRIVHENFTGIIFSLSLFVFNASMIYYSSEVKQYMTDVLVLSVIFFFTLKPYVNVNHKYIILSILGVISIFLSNVTPIILFTSGMYMLYDDYYLRKRYLLPLLLVSFIWILSFIVYYIFFIYNNSLRELMVEAHHKYFMPLNPLSPEFYKFFLLIGPMITCGLFRFTIMGGILITILAIMGIITLFKERKIKILILTITPFVLHLFLSGLELYPVQKRMILYISVCIILICSFGFVFLSNLLLLKFKSEINKLIVVSGPLIMSILMIFYIVTTGFPVGVHSDIKKAIKYIEHHMQKDDKVYIINWDAIIPFQYYQQISLSKIDTKYLIIDADFCSDSIVCIQKLEKFRGRMWFHFGAAPDGNKSINIFIDYFEFQGVSALREFHIRGSNTYLYDFGKPD